MNILIGNTFKEKDKDIIIANQIECDQLTKANYKLTDCKYIYVSLDISWGNAFSIIKYFRIEKHLTCPILIFSFRPLNWFLDNPERPEYNLLKTPGHYFFQLPVDFEEIAQQNFQGIDRDTLDDIIDHFFNLEGSIDEEFHDLKNRVLFYSNEFPENPEELLVFLKKEIKYSFQRIENALQLEESTLLHNIIYQLLEEVEYQVIEEKKYDGINLLISNYSGSVKGLLPKSEETTVLNHNKDYPWSLIFVDDDQKIGELVQKKFKERNVECEICTTAEETYELLEKGKPEKPFTILICDYRMLNDDKTWQPVQGYNIIKEVYLSQKYFLSYFSLTSFSKRTLLRVQKRHQMKVWSYSKDDVLSSEGGFNIFTEKIIEEGEKVYNLICGQPKNKTWDKGYDTKFDRPFKDYYRLLRLQPDFEIQKKEVGQKAFVFFREILNKYRDKLYESNIEVYQFQASIGKSKKEQNNEALILKKFKIKLIGRRIAIALFDYLSLSKGEIYNAMKSGRIRKEESNTINQFFSTYLALSLEKDIPNNLLPEEREWLNTLNLD